MIKRWIAIRPGFNFERDGFQKSPDYVEAFLDEIESVCRKHGMSISHTDSQGSFLIVPFSPPYVEWLRDATLHIPEPAWKPKS
jgi:hypothetical protein